MQGTGCGGTGQAVYPLDNNVDNTVIRVGLTPPPNTIGHATNPNQGCFDDKEGDDSVDWVFYENLHDKLAGQLCFDKNRVFASGTSGGFADELGCKYAGDPVRPIRGVISNNGIFPTQPQHAPTCPNRPTAGMWVFEPDEGAAGFPPNYKYAVHRAMKTNGCPTVLYASAELIDFPIGGGNPDTTCKQIMGCIPLHPLVVCALPGSGHGSHPTIANPGFSTFIKLFSMPPLLK